MDSQKNRKKESDEGQREKVTRDFELKIFRGKRKRSRIEKR